ncbi:MAG TPA: hypothetical protein VN677_11990 [Gemmatimonadaceae bacterium]|jgi:hypothetical protein|nr:hypothetical protein [Gemmatimonadaceae bacterium]
MDAALSSHLSGWENFYLITGPSAAALTGLQFVVIALVAEAGMGSSLSVSAFGTPTILHFCTVLLLAGIVTAPWATFTGPALTIGACGLAGLVYMTVAVRRSQRQGTYKPVLEDWIWYAVVPLAAYLALIIAAGVLPGHPAAALFTVGTVALLLLFLGIRNAWDTVVYIAVVERERAARTAAEQTALHAAGPDATA